MKFLRVGVFVVLVIATSCTLANIESRKHLR